jgi:hypothetical protein
MIIDSDKVNFIKMHIKDAFALMYNIILSDHVITEAINSTISLEELFLTHNINYNLNYLVLSMPKTGNHFIYNAIKTETEDVYFAHSIIEFLFIDIRFINYTIKDIINYISSKTKYNVLYVIQSYREPQERYISRYLWNVKIGLNKINILENVNQINDAEFETLNNNDYELCYVKLLEELDLNLENYTYDKLNGYTIIPYNDKIHFIYTRIEDITKFLKNFCNIDSEKLNVCMNVNELNKRNITFNKTVKDIIYENEKMFLEFYNTY